jgi:hypothetical protein
VAVYVSERLSKAARKAVGAVQQVPFTLLHELEVENAFAWLAGRGAISSAEHDAVRGQLREDVEAQRLLLTQVEWDDIFMKAREFSATYTARLFTGSLDLLHVAAALYSRRGRSSRQTIGSSPWRRRPACERSTLGSSVVGAESDSAIQSVIPVQSSPSGRLGQP